MQITVGCTTCGQCAGVELRELVVDPQLDERVPLLFASAVRAARSFCTCRAERKRVLPLP
jgi:hypothetical protein